MIERRPPPLRRSDVGRLRTLSAGVLGGVPGSVPVSASGNGASVPSSIPVVPYAPIHALTASDLAAPVPGVDLPRFCMSGIVAPALSPVWAVEGTIPVAEMFIVMLTGTSVELDVIVNGASVWTDVFDLTTSNGWAPSTPFTLVLNDGVQIDMIAASVGAADLTVVLRPALGSSGLLN